MSETTKMWIWMCIALVDTFIIINNEMKIRRGNRDEWKHNLCSKKR